MKNEWMRFFTIKQLSFMRMVYIVVVTMSIFWFFYICLFKFFTFFPFLYFYIVLIRAFSKNILKSFRYWFKKKKKY
jgi:hypothetical protein